MTQSPSLAATRAVRILDVIGLALLAYLVERTVWSQSPSTLDLPLAAVTAVGLAGAILSGGIRRSSFDVPAFLYVGLVIVSYLVMRGRYPEPPILPYDWQPAIHFPLLLAYVYAAAWLLRTPRRLAVAVSVIVAAASLFAVMATADHMAHGIENRIKDFSSLGIWGGYTQLGLFVALGFPFSLAVVMLTRSPSIMAISTVITAAFVAAALAAYSRAADVAMMVTFCVFACFEPFKLKRMRLTITLPVFVAIAVAFVVKTAFFSTLLVPSELLFRTTERLQIWQPALELIRSHPLAGVGFGNYYGALRFERPDSTVPYFLHAHNMFLQVAAESGLPAMFAFVWMWVSVLTMSIRGRLEANLLGILKLGCFGALAIVVVKGMGDSALLSGLVISERMSVVVWTLFALVLAVVSVARDTAAVVAE